MCHSAVSVSRAGYDKNSVLKLHNFHLVQERNEFQRRLKVTKDRIEELGKDRDWRDGENLQRNPPSRKMMTEGW